MLVRIQIPGGVARFVRPRIQAQFQSPLPARTAILVRGFAETRRVRVFPEGWSDRVARFEPEIVAARIVQLRKLACSDPRPEISHALVVLRYDTDPPPSKDDRDRLWRLFGVPVFEQYLNERNEVLAMECDAHAGLHVVQGCLDQAFLDQTMDATLCCCGNPAPRFAVA